MPAQILGRWYIGRKSLGTALDGDTVEVAPFASHREKKGSEERTEGEIVAVVSRAHDEFVGTLEQSKNFFFVVVDDRKIPRDIHVLREALNGAQPGDKVVVAFESWDNELAEPGRKNCRNHRPLGRFKRRGRIGDQSIPFANLIPARCSEW